MPADSQTWGLAAVERRSTTDHVLTELRAAIVSGRIGPNEPVVWSSKAIVTRASAFTSSRMRGSPRGAASAARTAPSRSTTGGSIVSASLDRTVSRFWKKHFAANRI